MLSHEGGLSTSTGQPRAETQKGTQDERATKLNLLKATECLALTLNIRLHAPSLEKEKTLSSLDWTDTRRGIRPGVFPIVQVAFKDLMIHWILQFALNYRISLRSSSLREPRYPLLRVVLLFRIFFSFSSNPWARNYVSISKPQEVEARP